MGRYDYKSLSPQDFEELTRDLLQAEWEAPLEAFKAGRDQGIDLRYTPLEGKKTIVQCKHYASSSFSSLLSHLRTSELPKVQRLMPERYVVVTSLPLSPAEKDKILKAFRPFISTTADIIGADDLAGLLSRHPEIERRNFKLWLTSTTVLERVLHNAEVCQTEFEVDRIRRKLPCFVQSKAFPRAYEMLEEQRVVVVSGVPGIGKTTLAEMLLYAHLEDGYEPVVIQTTLLEGKKQFRPKAKQVFYYDDFLGQTFLGDQRTYLGGNHDVALIDFMDMVRSSEHGRFILTTREHVLRRAFQVSERFMQCTLMAHRCVLELGDYSFGQRARVLYNHLYFSDLTPKHKEAVLENDFFLDIIKHDHFNPRLIEWLSSLTRLQSPEPENYKQNVIELLESPESLWSHAYHNQISDAGRDLLLSLYSVGEGADVIDLEPIYEAIHRGNSNRYNRSWEPIDYKSALQELDGAFLSYRSGRASFINPSIREFTAGLICRAPKIALDLLSDSIRFRQLSNIWDLALERNEQPLLAAIASNLPTFVQHAERLLNGISIRWDRAPEGLRGYTIDMGEERRLEALISICEKLKSAELLSLTDSYADRRITNWGESYVAFTGAISVLQTIGRCEWFYKNGGQVIYRKLLNRLLSRLELASAYQWKYWLEFPETAPEWLEADERALAESLENYRIEGVNCDHDGCENLSDLSDLQHTLRDLYKKHGIDFSSALHRIEESIAERDEDEPEGNSEQLMREMLSDQTEVVTEEDVREMFSTLKA